MKFRAFILATALSLYSHAAPLPGMMTITPDGKYAYICDCNSNAVKLVSLPSLTAIKSIPIGGCGYTIGISTIENKAYVVNNSDSTLTVISLSTNTAIATFSIGYAPNGILIDPCQPMAYILNQGESDPNNPTDGYVIPLNLTNNMAGIDILPSLKEGDSYGVQLKAS